MTKASSTPPLSSTLTDSPEHVDGNEFGSALLAPDQEAATPLPEARTEVDANGLEILDPAECLRLLATRAMGRLVFTRDALPAVRLATFAVEQGGLIFATADDDRYRAAERGDVVAFEVDDIDEDEGLGWRVTVVGRLAPIDPEQAAPLIPLLPVRAWAPIGERQLVRLTIESYDGRRLASRPDET
ncbi:pyridoxamine 5'-phosphate oxidase-like protein [Kribbella amoyensis]|uniref:Pyridoxamine 5'-phosphate oxidase-like protein n=1 Tax=Kribbella amoyensis TaxID=996641 RepID=A0A561BYU4_9ACTN|nr:pyridoxamine 5'-phosphate oxidase family protein [Kribbella amoyensis]TWD84065.1 pyridoxamine 5'-phosphate oxidase-like protein [Kribbella amoyensis]